MPVICCYSQGSNFPIALAEGYCLSLEEDLYKLEFKYYKARQSPPDLSQVLDVGKDAANFTWRQIEIGDNDSGINSTVKVSRLLQNGNNCNC